MALTFAALGVLVMSILSEILLVSGQSGGVSKTVVSNSDPQMAYSPVYCSMAPVTNCFGAWWDTTMDDGSVIKTTAGPSSQYKNMQTTLSYSFYGSSLELHGLVDADGANMIVQIDNFLAIVNTSTGTDGGLRQPSIIGNYSNLDPQTIHTLSIGWCANSVPNADAGGYDPLSYAYFDHLVIGDFRAVDNGSSASSSSATSSPTAVASSAQSNSTKLKSGAIAGIVVALLLFTILLCASSFYLRRHRHHLSSFRRRPASQHIRVMVESQESRYADSALSPVPSASWKARPHLSLPPAYVNSKGDGSNEAGYGADKGVSYLDLEAGSMKSVAVSPPSQSDTRRQKKRKSRRSLFPAPFSPLRSPRMSYPPRAKLQLNTRESAVAPRHDHFAKYTSAQPQEEQELSPVTPFTPYSVGTANVARPQNAQLISKASFGSGEGSSSSLASTAPLPPLPPLPSPREEKRRLAKSRANTRRSCAASRTHGPEAVRDMMQQLPDPSTFELELSATAGNARPSLDAMSIMTRSVPPPYALHI